MPDESPFPSSFPAPGDPGDSWAQLPRSVDAEVALLGSVLRDNEAMERLPDSLRAEQFFVPIHRKIFEAVRQLVDQGRLADRVGIQSLVQQDLASIGVPDYLERLLAAAMPLRNIRQYGDLILDLYQRRQLLRIGEGIAQKAADPQVPTEASEQIEEAEQDLFDLSEQAAGQTSGPEPFKSSLLKALDAAERSHQLKGELSGVGSGLKDLDFLLGGFHASDLIILAGRTGMGKTSLATNIAFFASNPEEGVPWETGENDRPGLVAFFSLEMTASQLANRILSEQTGIDSNQIRRGQLNRDEFSDLSRTAGELVNRRLFIDDTPGLTVGQLRTRARRLKRTEGGLRMIVVDYLQLMRGSRAYDSRVLEVTEISQGLKAIAKELNVPVIALSQLSRQVEGRDDRRPQLQDLRDSGSIEQDADVVLFVFREQYYLEREEPRQKTEESEDKFKARYVRWLDRLQQSENVATLIVAKQRHGPTGSRNVYFDARVTRFSDLEERRTENGLH